MRKLSLISYRLIFRFCWTFVCAWKSFTEAKTNNENWEKSQLKILHFAATLCLVEPLLASLKIIHLLKASLYSNFSLSASIDEKSFFLHHEICFLPIDIHFCFRRPHASVTSPGNWFKECNFTFIRFIWKFSGLWASGLRANIIFITFRVGQKRNCLNESLRYWVLFVP